MIQWHKKQSYLFFEAAKNEAAFSFRFPSVPFLINQLPGALSRDHSIPGPNIRGHFMVACWGFQNLGTQQGEWNKPANGIPWVILVG